MRFASTAVAAICRYLSVNRVDIKLLVSNGAVRFSRLSHRRPKSTSRSNDLDINFNLHHNRCTSQHVRGKHYVHKIPPYTIVSSRSSPLLFTNAYPKFRQAWLLFGFSSVPDLGGTASHHHNIIYYDPEIPPETTTEDRQGPTSILLWLCKRHCRVGVHENNGHLNLLVLNRELGCLRFCGCTPRVTPAGLVICCWSPRSLYSIVISYVEDADVYVRSSRQSFGCTSFDVSAAFSSVKQIQSIKLLFSLNVFFGISFITVSINPKF